MLGKLGKLARCTARPFAMLAVVMAVSLSMVVATPSTAHALLTDTKPVKPTFVMGAQKVLSPGITTAGRFLGGVAGGPWLRGAKMLGMLAFGTSDLWMPVDPGNFGTPPESKEMYTGDGYKILPGFRIGNLALSGNTWTLQWSYTGEGTQTGQVTAFWNCRQTIAETGKPIGYITSWSGVNTKGQMNAGTNATGTMGPGQACTSKQEVISGTVGPSTSVATTNGPENQLTYGDIGSFSPSSPEANYKARSECIDAAGVVTWIEVITSAANEGHVLVPSCTAAGKGVGTGRTQLLTQAPNSTTWETVWDTGPEPLSDPSTPLCDPGKTSGCTLTVEIDGKPCVVGDPECENWTEVNRDDSTSTRVKCKFGPYTLPTASCGLLEPAFRPGGAPVNEENTDGDPDTSKWTSPNGAPIAAPAPAPVAPSIGTAPVPGGSGQTTPSADQESQQCFPAGWAMFNPVEWVMKPVGCALRAAFVPSPTVVQTRTAAIQAKFENVGFARVTTAWLSTFEAAGGGSGCSGPTVNFDMSGVHQTVQPFNACSAPMSTVAAVSYAVSSIAMVLFGGLGIARAIAAGFGFNFSMGKGSDS